MVKFLTGYREVMGKRRVGMYDSSTLLIEENMFFSKTFNHGISEPLIK